MNKMRKNIKRITVILNIVSILLLAGCDKEKDIPVKYYENVIGEGYVFERYSDGTIMPHKWISIQAKEKQGEINDINNPDNYYHTERPEVDNNGKYTCRFLEKKRPSVWAWGWKTMKFYTIFINESPHYEYTNNGITYTSETIQEAAKKATKENPQIIPIDTIWVNYSY